MTPVTHGELHDAVAQLETKLAQMATRADLEIWAGALMARIAALFDLGEQRRQLGEQRLRQDLARHSSAIYESMSTPSSGDDDERDDPP